MFDIPDSAYLLDLPDDVFHDLKKSAAAVWEIYDNTFGYVTEKLAHVNRIDNNHGNAWGLVTMFDRSNQATLWSVLDADSRTYIGELSEQ